MAFSTLFLHSFLSLQWKNYSLPLETSNVFLRLWEGTSGIFPVKSPHFTKDGTQKREKVTSSQSPGELEAEPEIPVPFTTQIMPPSSELFLLTLPGVCNIHARCTHPWQCQRVDLMPHEKTQDAYGGCPESPGIMVAMHPPCSPPC